MSEAAVVNESRGRLLHNEQFAPFYDSVAFKNAPNLHAGLCGAKRWKERWLRCSLFRSLPLWPVSLITFLGKLLLDFWIGDFGEGPGFLDLYVQ